MFGRAVISGARCPAHADHDNSLSIGETAEGNVLLHCHAGCELEDVVKGAGLFISHLFGQQHRVRRVRRRPAGPGQQQ